MASGTACARCRATDEGHRARAPGRKKTPASEGILEVAPDPCDHMRVTGRHLCLASFGVCGIRPDVLAQACALLFQEGQYALGNLVRLGHHRGACLLQNLCARQVGRFLCEVGVHDARA